MLLGLRPLYAAALGTVIAAHGFDSILCDSALDAVGPAVAVVAMPGVRLVDISELSARRCRVLVLTAAQEPPVLARLSRAGAAGWFHLDRTILELVGAIEELHTGAALVTIDQRRALSRFEDVTLADRSDLFTRLSRREQQVLAELMAGKTAAEVASENFVAVSTVRSQIRSILVKLGVRSQLAAVGLAYETGWSEFHQS